MTTYDDMLKEVLFYFSEIIEKARDLKINDLVLDPGFGFAKTVEQNYRLLQYLDLFKNLERPILAGVSRKSMIYNTLGYAPEKALNGTTALHMAALERGANILRAHDVQEAMECISLFQALESAKMA